MKFLDEALIHIESGQGGAGCIGLRRAKYLPKGGPDGGDGGKGADIVFIADHSLSTLLDFHYKKIYCGESGESGQGQLRHGASAKPLKIRVPTGTVIWDNCTHELLADLSKDEQEFLALSGGRGGKGNHFFKNSVNQTPRFAQSGEAGQKKDILLELKLLADVAIIGQPNSGKSTLLSRISNAKPKIAPYPFTTLIPNLGVVKTKEKRFTIADIPGLIPGAHQGKGLGIKFLKHIERTKLFLHLIDIEAEEHEKCFEEINNELCQYRSTLMKTPQIIVLTKIDLLDSKKVKPIIKKFKNKGFETLAISALKGDGLVQLISGVSKHLCEDPRVE